MNFAPTARELEFAQQALAFGGQVLEPGTPQRRAARTFSRSDWQLLADAGYTGLLLPATFEGSGLNASEAAAALEALATSCSSTGLLFSLGAHLCAGALPLALHGNTEQQQQYLNAISAGSCIMANAMTEAGSGGHAFGLRTTAVAENDGYVLNGHKVFCTNAPLADLFLVYALTDAAKGFFGGISAFLLRRDQVVVGAAVAKVGLLDSPMAEVHLNDVCVSANQLLGKPGAGVSLFLQSMDWERTLLSALHTGSMQLLLNRTLAYVQQRQSGNASLATHQAVQFRLADMAVAVETARLLVQRAAQLLVQGQPATAAAAKAKVYVSEAYARVAQDALTLHGGNGLTEAYGIADALADAQAAAIYSGPNDVLRGLLASRL